MDEQIRDHDDHLVGSPCSQHVILPFIFPDLTGGPRLLVFIVRHNTMFVAVGLIQRIPEFSGSLSLYIRNVSRIIWLHPVTDLIRNDDQVVSAVDPVL